MSGASTQQQFEVRPIAGRIGAEIRGVDLREPLDGDVLQALRTVLAERGVVVFTGQQAERAHHRAFARRLGEVRMPPDYMNTLVDDGLPEVAVLSTENGYGPLADRWHADVTWAPDPPRYSVLHMQQVPETGGDTMWASQIDAYDRLSTAMKQFIEPLTAEHGLPSRSASATHPVVHRHPGTGRRALFVNPVFTQRIVELSEAESDATLQLLYRTITVPEAMCRWRWSVGDIAVWDNHFVLHYAIHDYGQASRMIHRIEVESHPPIPAGAA